MASEPRLGWAEAAINQINGLEFLTAINDATTCFLLKYRYVAKPR